MGHQPTFATIETDIERNKVVNVESLNAFTNISGGIITATGNTQYRLTKTVNFGTLRFVIPDGESIEITSSNLVANKMVSELTGTDALFSGDPGRLVIRNIDIEFTGGGGNLFDIAATTDPLPAVVLQSGRFIGGNSLGQVSGALMFIQESAIITWDSGITLDDNGFTENRGVAILGSSFANVGGTQITVKGLQSFITIQECTSIPRVGGFFINLEASIVKLNGATENLAFIINNNLDLLIGGDFYEPGSLDSEDVGIIAEHNRNSTKSNVIGSIGFEDNATATTIGSFGVYVDIAGTYVDNELERFARIGSALTYIGIADIKALASVDLSLKRESGNASRTIRAAVFLNGVEQGSASSTMTGIPLSLSFTVPLILETGDEIKVQIQNEQDTSNIIAIDQILSVNQV